jgi:predicted GIY-YIG superfamily endonuclease
MTNKSRTLYTGVTNNLERRVYEHKQKLNPGFTTKYNISRLFISKRLKILALRLSGKSKSKDGCGAGK